MEANIGKEGYMVGWMQIIVKKAAWSDEAKKVKKAAWSDEAKKVKKAAWLDGSK